MDCSWFSLEICCWYKNKNKPVCHLVFVNTVIIAITIIIILGCNWPSLAVVMHMNKRIEFNYNRIFLVLLHLNYSYNNSNRNERRGCVINTYASCFGRPGFKSRSADRLSWLRCSLFSSVLPRKCRDSTSNYTTTVKFNVFYN